MTAAHRLVRAAVVLALLLVVGRAGAVPPVAVRLEGCDVDEAQVRRLIALELGAPLEPGERPDTTVIQVSCRARWFDITVCDPLTNKTVTRSLELGAAAPAMRARLLAIAAVELASASWAELQTGRLTAVVAPPARDEARRQVAPVVEAARPLAPERLRLLAMMTVHGVGGTTPLLGATVRVGRDEAHRLGWAVDVQALHGTAVVPLGVVSLDVLDVGASLWLHRAWSRGVVRGGPGLRGGAVRFDGTPTDPRAIEGRTFWGVWLGPMLSAAADIAATPRLDIEIALEVGYVALPSWALAAGVQAVGMAGPWIGMQAGIGFFP